MRITRKFNLERLGHRYESIEIEVQGDDMDKLILEIQVIWEAYRKAITDLKVQ